MNLIHILLPIIVAHTPLPYGAETEEEAVQLYQEQFTSVQAIDQEIARLEDRRDKAIGRADRLEENADRWQFQEGRMQDARLAYKRAAEQRSVARAMDAKIKLLRQRRAQLLRKK